MNRIFKTVWNPARRKVVVVSEAKTTHCSGCQASNKPNLKLITASILCTIPIISYAVWKPEQNVTVTTDTTYSEWICVGGYFNINRGVTVNMLGGHFEMFNNDNDNGSEPFDRIVNNGTLNLTNGAYIEFINEYRGYANEVYNYGALTIDANSYIENTNSGGTNSGIKNFSSGTIRLVNGGSINFSYGKFQNEGSFYIDKNSSAKLTSLQGNGSLSLSGEASVNRNSSIGNLILSGGSFSVLGGNTDLSKLSGYGDINISSNASISTAYTNIFDSSSPVQVALNTISVNATKEETPQQIHSDLFTEYGGASVLASVGNLDFFGGSLHVTGVSTVLERDAMKNAFKEAFS